MVALILLSTQIVFQADSKTPMEVIGEIQLELSQNGRFLSFQAFDVKDLEIKALGRILFMTVNITIQPAKHQTVFSNGKSSSYGDKYQ